MTTRTIAILAHAVNTALIAALFILSVIAYDRLPDRIPVHYNFYGTPDRWSDASMLIWLSVPFILVGITALFYVLGITLPWFRKHPQWVNMPSSSREKFMALDENRRGEVLKGIAAYLYWFPVSSGLMFLVMRYVEIDFIVRKVNRFDGAWAVIIVVAGMALTIFAMIRGINRLVR